MADEINEIKKRLDIVEVVGDYLTLKKSGSTYKALCPFHSEKTPSFTVSAERQAWHCFGCNEGGDVISFVQKIDSLEFVDALKRLADRAGVELSSTHQNKQEKSIKVEVFRVLQLYTDFTHQLLKIHQSAKQAREYLSKRDLSEKMIDEFKLGYTPLAWHTTENLLKKAGIDPEIGVAAGLMIKKNGPDRQYYDRFRGRLLFPIDDPSGQVIGFTGRIIQTDTDQPKYLNSSESVVFKKGEALYAISRARQAIKQQDQAILVEGQMDVLALHQFGQENVVATSGTALTADHLNLLKRYTKNVYLALDADQAGQKAARAATILSFLAEMNPHIVIIPDGKDPDEAIRQNEGHWKQAVEQAKPAMDYYLEQELTTHPSPLSGLDKKRIVYDLKPLIQAVGDSVERADYQRKLALKLSVSEEAVDADLRQTKPDQAVTSEEVVSLIDLERQIIGLILAYHELATDLPDLIFDNQNLQQIYDCLTKQSGEAVIRSLPVVWQSRLNAIVFETLRRHEQLPEGDIKIELSNCLDRLKERNRERRVQDNAQAVALAFKEKDLSKARRLLKSLENDTAKKQDDQS